MKIIFEEKKNICSFKDIRVGQTFLLRGRVCMKIGQYSNFDYNAVSLGCGTCEKINEHAKLELVNCELIVNY